MSGADEQGPGKQRPIIQLPSLQEVQAAQRLATAPQQRFFRPGASSSSSSEHAPARPSTGGVPQQPPPPPDVRQGLGVFSPAQRPAPVPAAVRPTGTPVYRPPTPAAPAYQPPPPQQQQQQQAAANPNAIQVSRRQEGNPLLKHIRNVRWQYADIVPDYQMGGQHAALFLSLRYHLLKPLYIHGRIKELQRAFRLRVLLCHVDVEDVVGPLAAVNRIALLNECTLVCAWSPEEAARYLETYKAYEAKPADLIQGRAEQDYLSRLNAALTTVRGLNRTDVLTLGGALRTAADIMRADAGALAALPGIGPTKVRRLVETFHEPFRKTLRHAPLHLTPTTTAAAAALTDAVMGDDASIIDEEDGGGIELE